MSLKETVTARELQFRALLAHAWRHSPLYRRIYTEAGILERDLPHVPLHDLPVVGKPEVMEHLDDAFTDPRLRSEGLKRWLQSDSNPHSLYLDEFVVVHSSGGSKIRSIVPCTAGTWRQMTTTAAREILPVDPDTRVPLRTAFYFVSRDGHRASSTSANLASQAGHEVLQVTLEDPVEEVWARLNAFKPEHLSTYASTLAWLAAWALDGKLRIRPRTVLVSGDNLTPQVRSMVQEAWGARIDDLYAAVESPFIAVRKAGNSSFSVFNDLNVLEVVDASHRMVRPGELGRVLLTNLVNRTLPLIRFDLNDEAILGDSAFGATTIGAIQGKTSIRLPIRLSDGHISELGLPDLRGIDVAGCAKLQFVSHSPDEIEIRYESNENLDSEVEMAVRAHLAAKSATVRSLRVRAMSVIPNDAQTVKFVDVVTPDRTSRSLISLSTSSGGHPAMADAGRSPDPGFDLSESVFARFESIAGRHAARVAATHEGRSLTYAECREAAHRIARALLTRGFDRAQPIAVLSAHNMDMIAPLLGVLGAGGFYVALDPNMPRERLLRILVETQPEILLAGAGVEQLADEVVGVRTKVLTVCDLTTGLAPAATLPRVSAESPACLLYTSGSTGGAKGVVLSHRAVLSRVIAYTRDFGLLPTDRLSLLQPFSVSAGVRDLYGALLNGATLAVYDIRTQGVQPLAEWINREAITRLYAVPTAWRSLTDVLSNETFPTVRTVRLGGEAVQAKDLDAFKRRFSQGCQFVNGYAATETDTICQCFMDEHTEVIADRISVGWPVHGVTVELIDPNGLPVADAVGEITVAGDAVASGYWDPANRRVDPRPAGAFATGDLGYRLADGRIFLTGRRDFVVKLHGYRIDLREVERAISRVPGIGEAVAVVNRTQTGDPQLVVHYVTDDVEAVSTDKLQRAAAAVLPSSTVPVVFSPTGALPRLPGGKVNRNVLPNPAPRPTTGSAPVYETPTEVLLAGIWTTMLGLETIPRDADFLTLGGDSIVALRIISGTRHALSVDVSPRDFFDHATVAKLARFLDEHRR